MKITKMLYVTHSNKTRNKCYFSLIELLVLSKSTGFKLYIDTKIMTLSIIYLEIWHYVIQTIKKNYRSSMWENDD